MNKLSCFILIHAFVATQLNAQSDFNIDVTLGGAAGNSRTDFVDHNYSPLAIRNQRLVDKGFSFYAHPEISIYIEHHQLFGLKLSSGLATELNEREVALRPNLTLYLHKTTALEKQLAFGISFDQLKSIYNFQGDQVIDNHIGKGLFIGLKKNKIRSEFHINYYQNNVFPMCVCYYESAFHRFGFMLRVNYSLLKV